MECHSVGNDDSAIIDWFNGIGSPAFLRTINVFHYVRFGSFICGVLLFVLLWSRAVRFFHSRLCHVEGDRKKTNSSRSSTLTATVCTHPPSQAMLPAEFTTHLKAFSRRKTVFPCDFWPLEINLSRCRACVLVQNLSVSAVGNQTPSAECGVDGRRWLHERFRVIDLF